MTNKQIFLFVKLSFFEIDFCFWLKIKLFIQTTNSSFQNNHFVSTIASQQWIFPICVVVTWVWTNLNWMCLVRKSVPTTNRSAVNWTATLYLRKTVWRCVLLSTMTERTLVCRLLWDRRKFCAVYRSIESEYDIDWNLFTWYFQTVSCVSLLLIILNGRSCTIFMFKLFYLR